MIRYFGLHILYIYYKIKYWSIVRFVGFTIIFADKKSEIIFEKGQKKIVFCSSKLSNLLGISQPCIVVARHGGKIEIGEGTAISGSTIYSMANIEIGKNVLVGVSCKIIDSDFHPLRAELREPYNPVTINKKAVKIGDGCFIGANSIILKGTILGNNCVVGAGSVVSGNWPDNSIIAGNPAKFIREISPIKEMANK